MAQSTLAHEPQAANRPRRRRGAAAALAGRWTAEHAAMVETLAAESSLKRTGRRVIIDLAAGRPPRYARAPGCSTEPATNSARRGLSADFVNAEPRAADPARRGRLSRLPGTPGRSGIRGSWISSSTSARPSRRRARISFGGVAFLGELVVGAASRRHASAALSRHRGRQPARADRLSRACRSSC